MPHNSHGPISPTSRLPEYCPVCDEDIPTLWSTYSGTVSQVYRDCVFKFQSVYSACDKCGFQVMSNAMADHLAEKTRKAYHDWEQQENKYAELP